MLKRTGGDRLTGSKYLWRRPPGDMSPAQRQAFRAFWEYTSAVAARTFFTRWFWRATHSRLHPLAQVAKLIQRHLPNLPTKRIFPG